MSDNHEVPHNNPNDENAIDKSGLGILNNYKNPITSIAVLILAIMTLIISPAFFASGNIQLVCVILGFIFGYKTVIKLIDSAEKNPGWLHNPQIFTNEENWLRSIGVLTNLTGRTLQAAKEAVTLQKVKELDDKFIENNIFRVADKLLKEEGVKEAVAIGRAYLMIADYDLALKVFNHLEDKLKEDEKERYQIWANQAYCYLGKGKYDDAIRLLLQVKDFNSGRNFATWHAVGLADAYYLKEQNKSDDYWDLIKWAKQQDGYEKDANWFQELYPEIANDLKVN
jgi:tetratricopeptide (TPR) repeat protein